MLLYSMIPALLQSYSIQDSVDWQKDRQMDQRNRMENP